jgi:glycosyltransferase involved in cell wall biosynthesis
MKIAQVSPLIEAVPPKLYGGTERIVAYLTDALIELGHEVTLFASADSQTKAELAPAWPSALRLDKVTRDPLAPHISMLETVARRADEFDIVHLHVDFLGFPFLQRADVPFLATLHGRLDLPELIPIFELFADVPIVSISDAQREPLPQARYIATVAHGLPERMLLPGFGGGGYLAFLGRIAPEKAPDAAIRIAARSGMPLKIAAKIDDADKQYYEESIAPLLSGSHVEFVGEIGEREKADFLGNAAALLFPIVWPEPFGLVMIEAMACATPVVAYRNGSVPEVIDDGVTGFIVDDEEAAVAAVGKLPSLNRAQIRHTFERRFTAKRMAEDYLRAYQRLIALRHPLKRVV